jgi:hypothetical protein
MTTIFEKFNLHNFKEKCRKSNNEFDYSHYITLVLTQGCLVFITIQCSANDQNRYKYIYKNRKEVATSANLSPGCIDLPIDAEM